MPLAIADDRNCWYYVSTSCAPFLSKLHYFLHLCTIYIYTLKFFINIPHPYFSSIIVFSFFIYLFIFFFIYYFFFSDDWWLEKIQYSFLTAYRFSYIILFLTTPSICNLFFFIFILLIIFSPAKWTIGSNYLTIKSLNRRLIYRDWNEISSIVGANHDL